MDSLSQQNCRIDLTNFYKFNWNNIVLIKVENCTEEITPQMLLPCHSTLSSLELWGMTPFKTLEAFLLNCANLSSLILSNISLSSVPTSTSVIDGSTDIIELTRLRKLKLIGDGPLTRHEITLLSYLSEHVLTKTLKSLSLVENNLLHLDDVIERNEDAAQIEAGNIAVSKLLNKNTSTIKSLTIYRSSISTSISLPDNLQLDEFICSIGIGSSSSSGMEILLKNQTNLTTLIRNLNGVRLIPSSNPDCFYEVIEKCSKTLKTVHIDHIGIIRRLDRELNNDLHVAIHDFKLYDNCQILEYLYVGISHYHRLSRYHLIPGQIINVKLLPVSLKTLFIIFDIISDGDAQILVQRLGELINLRSFSAKGNVEMPFRVDIKWIQVLTELPRIRYFLLTGCNITGFQNVMAYIASKPELGNLIEITPEICAYSSWRNL